MLYVCYQIPRTRKLEGTNSASLLPPFAFTPLQASKKHDVLYILTKAGYAYLYDIPSGASTILARFAISTWRGAVLRFIGTNNSL